jgi:hypothetical protein
MKFHENLVSGGTELLIADGRTDMTRLIAAFRSFANAPKTTLMHTECILVCVC